MENMQSIKDIVRNFHNALDRADAGEIATAMSQYTTEDYHWYGMHPFYEQWGVMDVADVFWEPLRRSIAPIQRRADIFFAGKNQIDNESTQWVAEMGHLMGLFDEEWLGIPPTRKMIFLPYVEFNRVENGKICETAFFCDLISVMKQAGLQPLPEQTGAFIIQPGPRTHDGLLYGTQDPKQTAKTLKLINRMCDELTGSDMHSTDDELRNTWHEDMIWFGPTGIGATYTIPRYEVQHQGPFNDGLKDITFNGHMARFAEGSFGGWFGWANLSMKTSGGFLGLTGSDIPTEMRVVDLYRRDGDKLAENWVFIDLLHFLHMQGLDVLGRLKSMRALSQSN
ncbi:polyketide cyclase [Kineobactrum sediminis]|uniref:Polyketide cyclase n=1 Tax=Kineobactrum sediminis TaxID=1905677 RepID=A0A2N5XZ24_9GAMM|nr:nuclear transport factor 2 family protein [Kineobactrum sediminis]PLW81405.1 polyketide cyclase [Kineobactrum sediminis]